MFIRTLVERLGPGPAPHQIAAPAFFESSFSGTGKSSGER